MCVCVYAVYGLCCVGYRRLLSVCTDGGSVFFIYLFLGGGWGGVGNAEEKGKESRGKEGCISDAAMPRSRGQQ